MKIEPPSLSSGSAFCNREQRAARVQPEGGIEVLLGDLAEHWRCAPVPALAHNTSTAPFSRLTVSNKRSRSSRLAASPCTPVTFRPINLTASSRRFLPPARDEDMRSFRLRTAWRRPAPMPVDPPVINRYLAIELSHDHFP